MKIIWSFQAEKELGEIVFRIALDMPKAGERLANKVEQKVVRLLKFPRSGRMVPELGRKEIRELIFDSYRIIYRLDKNISILTIFHGAKKLTHL